MAPKRRANEPTLEFPVIDAGAFHEWSASRELLPHMPEGWRMLVVMEGERPAPLDLKSTWRYKHPLGGKAVETYPDSGLAPGTDVDFVLAQLFDGGRRERVVLGYHEGLLSTAFPQPYLAVEAVRAANDWTVEHWLSRDKRLFGHVLIVSGQPEAAAAEIRRIGSHEQMVAVALGANTLGRPFGHPVYRPVHEAAAELGLPLVVQVGCDAMGDLETIPVGIGLPATYAEYDVHCGQALMAHAASFVTEGVFDLFGDLQVLLLGGGGAWVPWCLWNMDYMFRQTRRLETPWMHMNPSEYFVRHIRLATYQLERPTPPERLAKVLGTIPDGDRMFLYASGYPNRDWEQPDAVAARIPKAWHRRVFEHNAEEFYRWPGKPRVGSETQRRTLVPEMSG
jgi:predicted TIM-barrel fold metal-dependent hydrolase